MQAPLKLTEQFDAIVSSSEPSHTALDKFLRGSLRSSNALARLLSELDDYLDPKKEGEPPAQTTIEEACAALRAQGFTF